MVEPRVEASSAVNAKGVTSVMWVAGAARSDNVSVATDVDTVQVVSTGQTDQFGGAGITGSLEYAISDTEMGISFDVLAQEDIWICDSGASVHTTNSKKGAVNERPSQSVSIGSSGPAAAAHSTVDIPGKFVSKDGVIGIRARLVNVSYNPENNFNLCSLTRMLQDGWTISKGDHTGITIVKGEVRIEFDIQVRTKSGGAIYAARFLRGSEGDEISAVATETGTVMSVNKAHELLGHGDEKSTRDTAKQMGWMISRGSLQPCEHCAKAKAKHKNVNKESTADKATKPAERMYLDGTKLTVTKNDGTVIELLRKYWYGLTDEATGKKMCIFTTTKDGMVEPVAELLHKLHAKGKHVQYIRMDPAGENMKLKSRCESADWKPLQPLKFEVTSRDTPQHNSLAELTFPVISNRARAMMSAANIPDDRRANVAVETIKMAHQLDGLRVVELNGILATRDEHFWGCNPSWTTDQHRFGEMGIVYEGKNAKTGDRGTAMMMVGYADREHDSKRMWNPKTNRTVVTRDIIWMKRMMFERLSNEIRVDLEIKPEEREREAKDDEDEAEEEEEREAAPAAEDAATPQPEAREGDTRGTSGAATETAAEQTTRSGRVVQPSKRYIEVCDTAYEVRLHNALLEFDETELQLANVTVDGNIEIVCVGAGVGGGYGDTFELKVMTYREAMKVDPVGWTKGVHDEKKRMDKFKALTAVKKSTLPPGTKPLTTVWACKKKSNGDMRARMNAHGFKQEDQVHYQSDNLAAPVTNPCSVRIAFTLYASNPKWIAKIVDVEGAFLQGEFTDGEVMYIYVPEGWEKFYDDDVVLRMNVPIYGTRQAAACFYKKLVKELKHEQYWRSKADPCMYFRWRDGRLCLCLSWVDDMLVFGEPQDVEQFEKDISGMFVCKLEGVMQEYVGNKVTVVERQNGIRAVKFTQPVLIQKLKDEYRFSEKGRAPTTPAVPGQLLLRSDVRTHMTAKEVTQYRSGTATLNYMAQWSRPDIQNAVREMTRQMSNPVPAHVGAMHYCMRYVHATPERGWTLEPDRVWDGSADFEWEIRSQSDANYASNPDDRRSVTGGVVLLNGAPIHVRCNTQKTVALSVTESEGSSGVSIAQDVLYALRVLQSIKLKVKLPMLQEGDNKGQVDLANNHSVGGRTRHVEVKQHFLRELKEDGLLNVRWKKGDDNVADIFTKNTTNPVFQRHLPVLVGRDEYMKGDESQT